MFSKAQKFLVITATTAMIIAGCNLFALMGAPLISIPISIAWVCVLIFAGYPIVFDD